MRIGFIGFGEAAYCISSGLRDAGHRDIIAFDIMASDKTLGKQIAIRAAEAEVALKDEPRAIVENSDIILVAVPSSYSLDVARQLCEWLKPGQQYADISASTPAAKQSIWNVIKDSGVYFTDAAVLGSVPLDRHRVPIMASGNGARRFYESMTPLGMRITCLDAEAGAASAVKLVRSIYMKGIAALMLETMQAADAYGISDILVDSIANSFDGIPFKEHLDRLVTGTAIHARRRAAELKGSIQMLEEIDIDAAMTIAAKHRHEMLESHRFNEIFALSKPKGYADIIERIRN